MAPKPENADSPEISGTQSLTMANPSTASLAVMDTGILARTEVINMTQIVPDCPARKWEMGHGDGSLGMHQSQFGLDTRLNITQSRKASFLDYVSDSTVKLRGFSSRYPLPVGCTSPSRLISVWSLNAPITMS